MGKKIMTVIYCLVVVCGFFLMLGAIGSFESNSIDSKALLTQGIIALVLEFLGFAGLKNTNPSLF